MFWPLLLSHLVADYPLQTDAMVQAKKTVPGLTVHVAVHLHGKRPKTPQDAGHANRAGQRTCPAT
jgi:hypothetical protein